MQPVGTKLARQPKRKPVTMTMPKWLDELERRQRKQRRKRGKNSRVRRMGLR